MLYLLAAIISGHVLGIYVRRKGQAYWLSVLVAIAVYLTVKLVLWYVSKDPEPFDVGLALVAGILSTPFVMLGVYLAQRKRARHDFSSEP